MVPRIGCTPKSLFKKKTGTHSKQEPGTSEGWHSSSAGWVGAGRLTQILSVQLYSSYQVEPQKGSEQEEEVITHER